MKYLLPPETVLLSVLLLGVALAQDSPETVLRGTKRFRKQVVISGLAAPWEITWGPDNQLWVTERVGKRISRIDPGSGERRVAITINEVSSPGGQDGLLGMALDPGLLQGTEKDYVYAAYTYLDVNRGADPTVSDPMSPYRYLYTKIVRLTYDKATATLSNPVDLITGLPAGNDHNAGRLKIGPDKKLYLTIGDHGNNQLGNYCLPIEAQRLPTQKEVRSKNYVSYVGKSLRLNLDGSVPKDNPRLAGVISHVYTYGHRNTQGIDFAPDGTLYASEHGPKTDDELNILRAGANYGWPHVAGLRDRKAFEYARWAEATTPCAQLRFSDLAIHPSVPRESESAFQKPFVDPIATMFTVPSTYNFSDPLCQGVDFICWPTVAPSSIEYYESKGQGIPGWDKVLLVTTLKRGSLYVASLSANGQVVNGPMSRYFQSQNRYRDTAVSPDLKTIYIATDPGGLTEKPGGGTATVMEDPGAILAFTYIGEGEVSQTEEPRQVSRSSQPETGTQAAAGGGGTISGLPPQFTAEQAAAGKLAYNSNCAVCHGSTMTNGTFGTPLAGDYFKRKWYGQTVRAFLEKSQKTMPSAAPGSLPSSTYADIVAHILEVNGFKAGDAPLRADSEALDKMVIQ